MKSFLPNEWSADGHLYLSLRNRLLENNVSSVFGLSPDQ